MKKSLKFLKAIEGEDNVVSQKIAKKKLDSKEQNLENDEE
jgi:hypothetical protein